MSSNANAIADNLLTAAKNKFGGDYSDVPEILVFWHNLMYLFFTSINYRRLFGKSGNGYDEMVKYGIMPEYLRDFYYKNRCIISECIDAASDEYFKYKTNVNSLRQDFLNIELDFSDGELKLFTDKVNRDNTGAYYTPNELALEIIKKSFIGRTFEKNKEYRIADFSCGGGDFFLVIMDYLKEEFNIGKEDSVSWFYGTDIDPIALQICIVNLLLFAEKNKWKTIVNHFKFGNPLVISEKECSEEEKNRLFATHRLYCDRLGMLESYFNNSYDVVVGNPPWEKIRFEERKFFRGIEEGISSASQKSARDEEVRKLKDSWPIVYEWRNQIHDEYSKMTATKYKHCKIKDAVTGELNTYALFTELAYNMLSENGFLALVVKSTLVTAFVNRKLWLKFLDEKAVGGIYFFGNKNKIFSIDSRERFVIFIASKKAINSFEFIAGLTEPSALCSEKSIKLTGKDLKMINPFTSTVPNVSSNEEIAFLKDVHNRFNLFSDIYPNCHFGRLIHLTAHSASIDKKKTAKNIPIYEGKFIEQYDARYATFYGMSDSRKYANKATARKIEPDSNGHKALPECRYFVHQELWDKFLHQYPKKYSLYWRSLTSPTNKRTMLAMIIPTCPTCQSIQMLQTDDDETLLILLALFNSVPFDYFVRIKMPGLDLTQSVIKQIPVPSDNDYNEVVSFAGKKCTLKKHILSYVISILKNEDRLDIFIKSFSNSIYDVGDMKTEEKQKMIDLLFKKVYHLDDDTYKKIMRKFPKY